MNLPRIISFSGRKGSGKTELAEICSKYSYHVIYFADYLKDMVCKCLDINRDTLEKIKDKEMIFDLSNKKGYIANELQVNENIIGDLSLFKSVRQILQILGTDIIRKYNPDWHINKTIIHLQENKDKKFCIGDCRFLNEKKMIENLGGECWYIIRPNQLNISNHISETQLNWSFFNDKIIMNTMEKSDLIQKWIDYLQKRTKGIKIESFVSNKLRNQSFLYLNEKTVYLLGFFNGSNVFIKHNILIIENDNVLRLKYVKDELQNNYNINNINSISIYNPFIIENLKLWNILNDKDKIPNVIKDNLNFTKMWISGFIDACGDIKNNTLTIKQIKCVLEFICSQYDIEFEKVCENLNCKDMYKLYLDQEKWLDFKKWLLY
jgi:hypothetical protein